MPLLYEYTFSLSILYLVTHSSGPQFSQSNSRKDDYKKVGEEPPERAAEGNVMTKKAKNTETESEKWAVEETRVIMMVRVWEVHTRGGCRWHSKRLTA